MQATFRQKIILRARLAPNTRTVKSVAKKHKWESKRAPRGRNHNIGKRNLDLKSNLHQIVTDCDNKDMKKGKVKIRERRFCASEKINLKVHIVPFLKNKKKPR
ncbi:hypothetical protein [Actinobacillus pleuropneumoniae]|uniref:hypothetical protein n=1 Tax=Actinobacillus pleuropneumoniae TaxID=715 RepID=UPI00201CC20E|nr:hypothetical protein [Actinobacillus pleuropneumoniae]UQZ25751.1 hypothetical protein M6G44_10815 [Actinobacillus pleuropneumoniae]